MLLLITLLLSTTAALVTAVPSNMVGPAGLVVAAANHPYPTGPYLWPAFEGLRITLPHGQSTHIPVARQTVLEGVGCLLGHHPDFTPAQLAALEALLTNHTATFAHAMEDLVGYSGEYPPFRILLNTAEPVFTRFRPRRSAVGVETAHLANSKVADAGFIVPAASTHYAAETTCVHKKDDTGTWTLRRLCGDNRKLNAATLPDHYAPPVQDEVLDLASTGYILSLIHI